MNKNKVVVIEDDAMLGSILMRYLAEDNIPADLLTTGEKALEILKQDPPKVLVLDIFIPVINGLDLLELIRKDEATKDINVVVISNTDQVPDRERATKLGAGFIVKAAVTPMFIVEQVKKIISK